MGSARSTFLDNHTGECEVVWRQPYQQRQSASHLAQGETSTSASAKDLEKGWRLLVSSPRSGAARLNQSIGDRKAISPQGATANAWRVPRRSRENASLCA
jgi:hypothetical protein